MRALIEILKYLLKKLPFSFTKNQRYDRLTKKIILIVCDKNSNCIDVGTHKGEILDLFLRQSPSGLHFGFEPVPQLYSFLEKKYAAFDNCTIYPIALSDEQSIIPFNYVVSNPAYSGIKKRRYDRRKETDVSINVETNLLDNIIPGELAIHFIKIDVEGGEMNVLRGARRILADHKPVLVFEFGLGGSDVYGTTPEKIYSFLIGYGYKIYLLEAFLNKHKELSLAELHAQFTTGKNYYFIAA